LKRADENSRVAADLKRLREIDGTQATIAAGAKLIGDDALAKEMALLRPFDIFEETEAWEKAHPYPKSEDPPEKKRARAEAELEISATWIAKAPERIGGYSARLRALEMLDAPVEQIARAGDDVVRIARTDSRAGGGSFIAHIAHVYVTRGILLDRVPALIEEALKTFDDPEAVIEVDLAPSQDLMLQGRMNMAQWHVSSLVTLSEYYEKVGQMEKARSVLAPVPAFLARLSVPDGVQDLNGGHNLLVSHALANYDYWKRAAEIDEHENKKEDALRDYREALLVWGGGRDNLLARQRQLWKDLGRSDEAWQAWVDSIPQPAWRGRGPEQRGFGVVHRPLPGVALKDLDGNEWPADRLAKTTIAIVWATWRQPWPSELPYFAKLAEFVGR
jgi:hypothetical protein